MTKTMSRKSSKSYEIKQPPGSAVSDKPWPPLPYLYECTNGHQVGGHAPIEQCLNFVKGVPCTAPLVRYGKGAGRGAHFKKVGE